MINQENLNKMYDGIIDGRTLTTKELNSYGFNSKDLSDLIGQGIIERIKRGNYIFLDVDALFYYGKYLISEKQLDKSTKCFEKCYELNPNHHGVCFQLFLRSIENEDYESAFKYFEVVSDTENIYYNIDANLYLYLLSIITNVPDKYKEYVKFLSYEDIKVDFSDKRYEDIPLQNKIRSSIIIGNLSYALKQLNDLIDKHKYLTVQDIITRKLLIQAFSAEKDSKNNILQLVKSKNYEEVVSHLTDKQKRHNLCIKDEYILKLTNDFLNIKETSKIPQKEIFKTENMFAAIEGHNYQLALDLNIDYNRKYNEKNGQFKKDEIYYILSDICQLIVDIKSPKNNQDIENKQNINCENLEVIDETKSTYYSQDKDSNFLNLVKNLLTNDLDNAFISLNSYLKEINKSDYESIIINLIKLSLHEKDFAFTKPMIELINISRENFIVDISKYVQEFYLNVSQGKFEQSQIYLDIILKVNELQKTYISTDDLMQVLEKTKEQVKLNNEKRQEDVTRSKKPIKDKPKKDNYMKPIVSSNTKGLSDIHTINNNLNNEKKLIEEKYDDLVCKQGVILLKPMSDERRKIIHEIVKEYPDMESFSIGEAKNRQIVLRYKPHIDERIAVKKLVLNANAAYKKGDYDSAIRDYLKSLQIGEPKATTYAKLGLSYMKKGNIDLAIDYLTIATEKCKEENRDFDFDDLITELKGLIPKEDKKPRFKMDESEFYNDIDDCYGIENFDEITTYILESGLDVESACQELGIDKEQIDVIELIYAKKYYSQGNYEKGDQFFKFVERSKDKTKYTIKLLNEIRKNKKYYVNRVDENSKKLTLMLQPK